MSAVLTAADLAGGDVVYLLTLTFAGRPWRWASRAVEVETEAGELLVFAGGLEGVDVEDALEMGSSDVPSPRSASFTLDWPEVPALVEQGHDLASTTGELAAWVPGTTWERRLPLLDGLVPDAEYGDASEGVSLSLEERPFEVKAEIIPAEHMVNGITWPDAADEAEGQPYPLVFGTPGPYTTADGAASKAGATPGLVVHGSADTLLIAGHPTKAGADGDQVDVNNKNLQTWASFTATHAAVDGDGRIVTTIDYTAEATWEPTHAYAVSWKSSAGIARADGEGYCSTAGDVLVLMLQRSRARVDWGRVYAAKWRFDELTVGGFVDDGDPLDWVIDNLLPLFPDVCLTSGPGGIYPWVDRPVTSRDVVAELVDGQEGVTRTSGVSYVGYDEVVNLATLSYAYGLQRAAYQRSRTITGDPTRQSLAGGVIVTHDARVSRARYGNRAVSLDGSDILYDQASADAVLSRLVAVRGRARRALTLGAPFTWAWLQKGDAVSVTVDALSMSARLGRVRAVHWQDDGVGFEVLLDPRATPTTGG
ncbi:MAG TPA: hypothetical protein VEA41_14675 [Salinarimonas sp.]|nr:hypothetical protein [Salinarimonas sp.]